MGVVSQRSEIVPVLRGRRGELVVEEALEFHGSPGRRCDPRTGGEGSEVRADEVSQVQGIGRRREVGREGGMDGGEGEARWQRRSVRG